MKIIDSDGSVMSVTLRRLRDSWPGILAALMGAIWLAVFPLWQDGSFSRITKAKLNGMHTLTYVMLGVFVLTLLLMLILRARHGQVHVHPVQLLALCYFGWVALSAWQGSWASQLNASDELVVWKGALRHEGLETHLFYAAIFLVMSFIRPRIKVLLRLCGVTLLAFFAIVLMQYAGLNPLNLFPGQLSIRTNYEFQGTIGNIDMVSGYLCLTVPLLLGGFVLQEKADFFLLLSGLCGVMLQLMMEVQSGLIALMGGLGLLAILLLTRPETRWQILTIYGGVLMLVSTRALLGLPWLEKTAEIVFPYQLSAVKALIALAGVLCWIGAGFFHRRPCKAVSGKATLLLALAFILLCFAAVYFLPLTQSAGGLWELQQVLRGNVQDSYGSYRLGVWRHTLNFSRSNRMFGSGPDTFYYVMKNYQTSFGIHLPETFDNPHNEYLAILSNNGLPAVLLYLTTMGTLIFCCIRARRRESLILSGAVILFMVQGFFSFSICLVTPMFWAVCGMACSWCGPDRPLPGAANSKG